MRTHIRLIVSAAAMLLLILDAKASAAAAARAVEICICTVIPSLFPFFLLSRYLTRSIKSGRWISRLFHMNENCGGVIVTGLLSGYPVGAKAAAEEYHSAQISKYQGDRLLYFCSQAGPSFLFGMVAAQFDKLRYVWILWLIQIASAATVAYLIPGKNDQRPPNPVKPEHTADSMHNALSAMGAVCGWVVVFSVIIGFLNDWILWLFPRDVQILLCGILELTSGCLILAEIESISLRLLMASVMLNFGGLCVLLQTVSVSSGLKIRNYILGKILQTAFAFLYSCLFLGFWHAIFPLIFIFFAKTIPFPGKKYSIPLQNSV